MEKIKYQIIEIPVTTAGEKKTISTNTKIEHDKITGVFASIQKDSDVASAVEVGSTIELTIDSEEIFPDGFEIANITKKVAVGINDLPHLIDEKAKNTPVKIVYKDGNSPLFPSGGYIVKLYLRATD